MVLDIRVIEINCILAARPPHATPGDNDMGVAAIGEYRRTAGLVVAGGSAGCLQLLRICRECDDRRKAPRRLRYVNVGRQGDGWRDLDLLVS